MHISQFGIQKGIWLMKNEVQEMINRTNGKIENTPMSHYSRVIIEREKDSEPIAVITNDDCEVADGFRVRLKPVYPD